MQLLLEVAVVAAVRNQAQEMLLEVEAVAVAV
jgi:hypothetical protein